MFGAVAAGPAAGGYATIEDARRAMARLKDDVYEPDRGATARRTTSCTASTSGSTTTSGAASNDVMKTLRGLRAEARRRDGRRGAA